MEYWNGHVAVVTGAADEIGNAICKTLLAYGLTVVACDDIGILNPMIGQEELIEMEYGGELHTMAFDMFKQQHIDSMFERIVDQFGVVDILINNTNIPNDGAAVVEPTGDTRRKAIAREMEYRLSEYIAYAVMIASSRDDRCIIINIESPARLPVQRSNAAEESNSGSRVLSVSQRLRGYYSFSCDGIQIWSICMKAVDPVIWPSVRPTTADIINEVAGILACPRPGKENRNGRDILLPCSEVDTIDHIYNPTMHIESFDYTF